MEEFKGDKRVYAHISDVDDKIFYIGSGAKYRPTRKAQRTKDWNSVARNGYSVRILKDNMTKEDSLELEELIIDTIGIDNLTNKGNHFTWDNHVAWNKGVSRSSYVSEQGRINSALSNSRKCINTETGVIYNSLTDACNDLGLSYSTTHKKLNGHSKNINNKIKYYGRI